MKRRSFFGALLGAAAVPLVKAEVAKPIERLALTSGDYHGSVEIGDKFYGVDRGDVSEFRGLKAWIPTKEHS